MSDLFERAIQKLEKEAPIRGVPINKPARRKSYAEITPRKFTLDFDDLEKRGFITPNNLQSRVAEEYRIVKRLALMSAFGKGVPKVERGNAIVITSSLEGEGKTFTALNLAISIAQERDSTVLLIDADLTRRTLTQMFGAQKEQGLSELLLDPDLDPAAVIGHSNMDKLRFIPAGGAMENAAELMASAQMERLVTELVSRYEDRVILFDSPPLLGSSQAVVLTQLVGQVLMVVEEGRTPQSVIREASEMIDEDKLVGMVLNRCKASKGGAYYGGYYGPVPGVKE